MISVAGPGQVFTHRVNRKTIALSLVGTTQDSQVTVTAFGSQPQAANRPLQISKIAVRSGRLGSFQGLTTVDLQGRMSPLTGPISSLQFDSIGASAKIDVNGNLGQLTVNRTVTLGSSGHINVTNDLTGSLSVMQGGVTLNGGNIWIGRDLSGSVTIGGGLNLNNGGQFFVGRNLGAATSTTATSGFTVTGNLSVDSSAEFSVGANSSALIVGGNVTLASGGQLKVGGILSSLSVGGNLQTSAGGEVDVLGNLGVLSVTGIIAGKGTDDIVVGGNLGQLTDLGGGNNAFSLQGVDVDVSRSIQGLDVRSGISESLITAGTLIAGGTPGAGSNGWNIGPSGTVAVFDTQILAGFEILNITIGGDVESDLPENPATGRVTRIVAGEDSNGNFSSGGIIDQFQILGRLVDAVLAASVEPYGGTGALPPNPTPPNYAPPTSTSDDNGYKTYDLPAGSITVDGTTYPTFTGPPYNSSGDPTIDDLVLPGGAINPSFATAETAASPLPSKSTVLGGVVSTAHGDRADFAGIFAANTSGVFVGPLPTP